MNWNGLALVNDFSAELGDTSPAFKTKVLRWINEGIKEIATSHQWSFLREKGKVVLTANQESHFIPLAKPTAPTVAALAGGSLALTYEYKVLVTFYEEASGVESIAGEISDGIIPAGADRSIRLSEIPVSTSPLVTARKIYVSKAGGQFSYYGMIEHNLAELPGEPDPINDPPIPVTFDITTETTSQFVPPEEDSVFMVDGDLYIEGRRILAGTALQDLTYKSQGVNTVGEPYLWAPVNEEEVRVYPIPSSDITASFYYFKIPPYVYGIRTSIPDMPSWLHDDLKRYVLWRGYDFRDRAGKESKEITFRENLKITISRKGKPVKRSGRVRSVTPDSDGMVD